MCVILMMLLVRGVLMANRSGAVSTYSSIVIGTCEVVLMRLLEESNKGIIFIN